MDTNFHSINVTNTIKGKSLKIPNTYLHIKLLNLVKRRNSIMRKLLHNWALSRKAANPGKQALDMTLTSWERLKWSLLSSWALTESGSYNSQWIQKRGSKKDNLWVSPWGFFHTFRSSLSAIFSRSENDCLALCSKSVLRTYLELFRTEFTVSGLPLTIVKTGLDDFNV